MPRSPERDERPGYVNRELGLELSDITAEAAQQLGLKEAAGALIAHVIDDSPAANGGLRAGMAILRVGNKPVKKVADFQAAIQGESLKEGVMLLIRTAGNRWIVLREKP